MPDVKSRNNNLERLALWFIAQGKSPSFKLFTLLNEDHFGNKYYQAVFKRFKFVMKKKNELMTWDDACEDTSFPEEARLLLKGITQTTKLNIQRCTEIFDRLEEYRKIRVIYLGTKQSLEEKLINTDTVDINGVIDDLINIVSKAQTTQKDDDFFKFGKHNNVDEIVTNVLEKGIPCIPSGIKLWDQRNGGIPLSSVMLIGANSGGGKSLGGDCLIENLAEFGAKCCLVSLEMDIEELYVRRLSRISSVDQGKIFTNSRLSPKEKEQIQKLYKEKQKRWEKEGKTVYTRVPKSNPSLEELLASLKPYTFDFIVIDYISLLRDMSGERQWQKLVDGVNYAKSFARSTGTTIIIMIQVTEEQVIKYAKGMIDGADLSWIWSRPKDAPSSIILDISVPKARKQQAFSFPVQFEYQFARITNVPDNYKPPQPKDMVSKELKNKVDISTTKSKSGNQRTDKLMKEFFPGKE